MEPQDTSEGLVSHLLQPLLGLHAEIAALEPDKQRKTEQRTNEVYIVLHMLLDFIKINLCDIFRRPRNRTLIKNNSGKHSIINFSTFQG